MLQNKGIHVDHFDSVILLEILVQWGKKREKDLILAR